MDYAFFDTSALVKRYYLEAGTDQVDAIIEDGDITVVITTLSIIETVSAFRRKYNAGDIDQDAMYQVIAAFFREALTDFVLLPMGDPAMEHALTLVLDDDLRTLDSLQLSAALTVHEELDDIRFICADTDLVATAEDHGINSRNPTEA